MLQFENLSAGYNRRERLHGITAAIRSGCLTAVIGPNGCGKTTLLKCAAGILKPFSGSIQFDGRILSSFSEKERARFISYMPQSRLTPDLSVRHLVEHGRYPHLKWGQNISEVDKKIISNALNRTEMESLADRSVAQLSGGERQRAYLAMMLAQQTPLMLLDEPTTYLDLSAQFSLMTLLRTLCHDGQTAVIVLHDLSLALEFADDIILLQSGKLIACGSPAEVFASGMLQNVFGITVDRTTDGRYLFAPQKQEKPS